MGNYKLVNDTYVISDYDRMPAFTSFLPGLSGVRGIPLWLFYVNRGQSVASFGIHNKSNAIMEFNPANTGYENTALKGFRTFIKIDGQLYEPFVSQSTDTKRTMYIKKNSLEIEEVNEALGFSIKVVYFILPNESIGALVRDVQIVNLLNITRRFEVLDGMPKLIPFGISNGAYKEMSNLLKSWTDIKNLDKGIPFITMRASSDDSAEVSQVEGGYYYLSVRNGKVVAPIYDAETVFGYDTSLMYPVMFEQGSLSEISKAEQCFANKIPCVFTGVKEKLPVNGDISFTTFIGFAGVPEQVNEKAELFGSKGFGAKKRQEADDLVAQFTSDIKTSTALPVFDQYMEQCYLDNFLRGGYPFVFGNKENPHVVHLFSRKHGDPERDYNFFSIDGEYYSQGNGNFRDVCQNRRSDVFFKKEIGNFNVKTFMELIQADGYNPLEVRPTTFKIKEDKLDQVLSAIVKKTKGENKQLISLLQSPFTPGKISNCIARYHIELTVKEEELLSQVLENSEQFIEAGFGEGYWSDHWDYILDLVENYEKVFPEKMNELLFDDTCRFYDSPHYVLPRSEKYVVAKNGVRQYGAGIHDEEKSKREGFILSGTNWMKDESGNYVTTTIMGKMISLALNKFATLDPYGMGVEMEGGKPGWNDAMNGLPGVFGSGMAESFELKRVLEFLIKYAEGKDNIVLLKQIKDYLYKVSDVLKLYIAGSLDDFSYWDKVSSIREAYRADVRFVMKNETEEVSAREIKDILVKFLEKLDAGIQRAFEIGNGVMPTYFTYEAVKYDTLTGEDGEPVKTHYGLPQAVVREFDLISLPLFLEGPARMLGTMKDHQAAKKMYAAVKKSGIYDKKLKMYKTSESLEDISMENGRIRAFTPGWLERESIFLHMEYKYLLAMLKAGLCEEFYEDIKGALIPFLEPEVYGRSILENSSFLASSENPDKKVHGRGYVSRLSGSTTEMISMWIEMFCGSKLFTYENDTLSLTLEPKLSKEFFERNGEVSFQFLSTCKITYKNPAGRSTFGKDGVKVVKIKAAGGSFEAEGNVLTGIPALAVREGRVKELIAELG